MWPRFGIKIGNSTICVAASKEDGKVEVIANKHGNRVSHAVLLMNGDEVEVGLTAKQKLASKGTCSVVNNFQFLAKGMSEEQLRRAVPYLTCQYDADRNKYELIEPPQPGGNGETTETVSISPYEVCVEFFKASFELARQCHILEEHPSIVLSIPNYYSSESWKELAEAAEEAGFHVAQVIPEHTAALLAYEHLIERFPEQKRVLCIKSGGLLSSISIFDIEDGLISLVGTAGPYYIGGKQFTDVIKEFICTEFFKKYKLDPAESRRSIAKVQNAAEDCKHILTSLPSTQIYIDSLMDGVDFNTQMSRARYEMLIQPVLNEFMSILNQAVETVLNGISNTEGREKPINEIVISGGTMKIPKIQAAIGVRFPDAKLNCSLPPDEVVAMGCATQSLYIDSDRRDGFDDALKSHSDSRCFSILDDIVLWHSDDSTKKLKVVEKGTLLPVETVVEVERPESKEVDPESDSESAIATFNVRCADSIGEVKLLHAKAIGGVYRMKALVEEIDGRPKITLINAA